MNLNQVGSGCQMVFTRVSFGDASRQATCAPPHIAPVILAADRHINRAMKCGECGQRGMRVTAYHRGRDYRLLCRRRASTVRCAGQVRWMSKGEGSRAVGRGSDGTGDCNAFFGGESLRSHLRGLDSTFSLVAEARRGQSGKDRLGERSRRKMLEMALPSG